MAKAARRLFFLILLVGCTTSSTERSAPERAREGEGSIDAGASSPGAPADAASDIAETGERPEESGDALVVPIREIVIQASGDLLVHRAVCESASRHEDGFGHVLAGMESAIREPADLASPLETITFVNLETPLSESYVDPVNAETPTLGSPSSLARDLADIGVDVVSLANNHAMDQTPAGLRDSWVAARAAGLAVVGVGVNLDEAYRPWFVERGGITVAFVGVSRHVNRGAGTERSEARVALLRDEERTFGALREARARADVVVAAIHWSSDFVPRPTNSQRRLARRLVEAGADLILGSGPHILQEIERLPSPRGEAVVAYSLGNLVSNQGLHHIPGRPPRQGHRVAVTAETRDVVLLRVRLGSPERGRLRVVSLEAIPLWTENNFWARRSDRSLGADISLVRLRDATPAVREERSQAISRALGPEVSLAP